MGRTLASSSLFMLLLVNLLAMSACTKTEGEGGRTDIEGVVYYHLYDPEGNFLGREEARNEDVFIVYGDNDFYDDDLSTAPDGTYEFRYLQKGTYTLFGYSDCQSCDSGQEATEISVDLSGKNEVITAPDLELIKQLAPDDGSGTITGRIKVNEYNTTGELVAEYFGPDREVYITYGTSNTSFERVRTSPDGYFSFPNLITGTFTVYAYSDCDNCTSGVVASTVSATLAAKGESVDVGLIEIDQR